MKRLIVSLLAGLLLCQLFSACGNRELTEGTYRAAVTLSGGSGRASVESPAQIIVSEGNITARIVWSSPYYEYMLLDGLRYEPVEKDEHSVFVIPIVLDEQMEVQACTSAMSQEHLVDYTLYFESKSIKGDRG